MEENNVNNENETQVSQQNTIGQNHICFQNHCWKMCLGMVVAAFLGGFLATYFVTDQMFKFAFIHHQAFNPVRIQNEMFRDMHRFDREIDRYNKDFDRDFDNFGKYFKNPHKKHNPLIADRDFGNNFKLDSDMNNRKFEVEVDLRPFNNDESKVNFNVRGRKLTVFGDSEIKEDGYEEKINFTQDYILPKNADIANISKKRDGNKLEIIVPLK